MKSGRLAIRVLALLAAGALGTVAGPRALAHNGEAGGGAAPGVPPTLGPPAAGPSQPEQPLPGTPRVTTGGRGSGWTVWWESNADRLTPPRRRAVTAVDGGAAPVAKGRTMDDAVQHEVLPTLLWALDPKRDFSTPVVVACHLALGKLARRAEEVAVLVSAARRTDTAAEETESAILALGLLRRTDPARRLDEATLALARHALLTSLDDPRMTTKARSLSALALGLLADQGPLTPDPIALDLWNRLTTCSYAADEIPVALIEAIGRFPPASIPSMIRLGLRRLGTTGFVGKLRYGNTTRSHAMLALARVDDTTGAGVFLAVLHGLRFPDATRLGALVGLGIAAPRLDSGARVDGANRVREVLHGEIARSGFTPAVFLSVARLAAADLGERRDGVLEAGHAADTLLDGMSEANLDIRPFAMLALGIVARPDDAAYDVRAFHDFRSRALKRLRGLLKTEAGSPDARGAFLIGLGLMADEDSIPAICEVARAGGSTESPRGYACEALGLIGRALPEATSVLRDVATEKTASAWLREKAAHALARLGGVNIVPELAAELAASAPEWRLAAIASTLGACAHVDAVLPLVRMIRDKKTKDGSRAGACEALGRLGDPETFPSLSVFGQGTAELPATDGVGAVLQSR